MYRLIKHLSQIPTTQCKEGKTTTYSSIIEGSIVAFLEEVKRTTSYWQGQTTAKWKKHRSKRTKISVKKNYYEVLYWDTHFWPTFSRNDQPCLEEALFRLLSHLSMDRIEQCIHAWLVSRLLHLRYTHSPLARLSLLGILSWPSWVFLEFFALVVWLVENGCWWFTRA